MQARRTPRNEVRTVVVPGRSITFEARDFAHQVWDWTWEAYVWDDTPGAADWFSALPLEAIRSIGRLARVGPLFAGDQRPFALELFQRLRVLALGRNRRGDRKSDSEHERKHRSPRCGDDSAWQRRSPSARG